MATSPLFGWEEPDDTDLVKDGAAAIRTLGDAIDTSMGDLLGGSTGQVLAKASGTNMDFAWNGASTSWSPSVFNLTLGNGTLAGSYVKIGKLVHARLLITLGSTSSVAGTFVISAPTTANGFINANVNYEDAGVNVYPGFYEQFMNDLYLRAGTATTTYVTNAALSSTIPFTWGSGDKIYLAMTYEEA